MPDHDNRQLFQLLIRDLRALLVVERVRESPRIPERVPPAASFTAAQINRLLSSPMYSIGRCYRADEKNEILYIRESARNPPSEYEQARFRQMTKQHLAGAHVARYFTQKIRRDNEDIPIPCWEFVLAPTNKQVWDFFERHFNKDVPQLYNYAMKVRKKLAPLLSHLKPEEEEKMGTTFQAPLVATLPTVPVSFPDTPDVVFDLCGEVLKLIPERDGRISNPFTRQCYHLKDLQLREDVVEILVDRINVQQNPSAFFNELFNLQAGNEEALAEPVKEKLAHLKSSQRKALSDHVLQSQNLNSPFINLLILQLISLEENAVIDEFEARYGIQSQSIKCKEQNVVFSFTHKNYQALLKEYENNPALLPLIYTQKDLDTWEVTLNIQEYTQMIQDNEENVKNLLAEFNRYHEHLTQSESSRFKRTVLRQTDLNTKKEETLKLIQALHGSMHEEGCAKKLIAFRKMLPDAAKKLNVCRDEWPWWLMKVIITVLTLGIAHYCCKIWKIKGEEQVSEVREALKPKRS